MNEKYSEIELKISFNTPCFLGNAYQQGQWRTPPFKALLRQWWRVVKASKNCDLKTIRSDEAILFGNAFDEKDDKKEKIAQKSALRLKFNNWNDGKSNIKVNAGKVIHPEVTDKFTKKAKDIETDLYLGYGAITVTKTKQYITINEQNTLWIGFPEHYKEELIETIQLIAWFGAIGSRSRNSWGSIRIESAEVNGEDFIIENEVNKEKVNNYSGFYKDLLKNDWANKIGKDKKDGKENLLIWKTSSRDKYEDVLNDLARIKIDYRTHFKFPNEKPGRLRERHIISYPITNHPIIGMRNPRKPNQLRFKVIKDKNNKYYGLIFHLPCKATKEFFENQSIKNEYQRLEPIVWEEVHSFLDNCKDCSRL